MWLRNVCAKQWQEGAVQNTASEGTGALLRLPTGYSNRGVNSTAAARTHLWSASCCVDACLGASLVSQSLKSPYCVVHKIILSCHLDTSYRISSRRYYNGRSLPGFHGCFNYTKQILSTQIMSVLPFSCLNFLSKAI